MSYSNDAEMLKLIHGAASALKIQDGFTARWGSAGSAGFIKEATAIEAAMAHARGVLTAVATHFTPEPDPYSEVFDKINRAEFDGWAEANDEPSMTTTELHTVRRFLEAVLQPQT